MSRITITQEAADRLSMERWIFWYDDRYHRLTLDIYSRWTRATLRHKYRPVQEYQRLAHRRDTHLRQAPVLPDWVRTQAKQQFLETLEVGVDPS